jgi:hypothetical protein
MMMTKTLTTVEEDESMFLNQIMAMQNGGSTINDESE